MMPGRTLPRVARQSNLTLQLLAVILSIFLWGFVKFTQTPFSATISQADIQVPLKVTTDPDMAALDAPSSVDVTVRGSEETVREIKGNTISATIDLRGSTEGHMYQQVHISQPPDLSIVSVQPDHCAVNLVPVVTESFQVKPKLIGRVADGYTASAPMLRTATVNVSGPQPYVQQVQSVVASISLNNTETGMMQQTLLEPRDEAGNVVSEVKVKPDNDIVTVSVTPAIMPKLLPVFPHFIGAARHGVVLETAWTPRMLPVVFGQAAVPASSLYTAPIDVGALGPGEHRFKVAVPAPVGGTLVKDKEVQVTIRLKPAPKSHASRSGAALATGDKPSFIKER